MVSGLLDSSVLIDVLRNHIPADRWLKSQTGLGYPELVWHELAQGAKSKANQRSLFKLLTLFEEIPLDRNDLLWARSKLPFMALRHGIEAFDCLIAASAVRLNVPLYTTNLKHFAPLLGSLAIKPY